MELKCPKCGDNIDARLANTQTNLMQCPSCDNTKKSNQLIDNNIIKQRNPIYNTNYDHQEVDRFFDDFSEKPTNSKLDVFRTSSNVEIIALPMGLKGGDIFGVFWILFISLWTILVLYLSILGALFSIPFWIAGFFMNRKLSRKFEKQYIEMDSQNITIRKRGLFFSNQEEISLYDIDSISMEKTLAKPVIQVGVKKITFLENISEIEQDWVIKLLNKAMENNR